MLWQCLEEKLCLIIRQLMKTTVVITEAQHCSKQRTGTQYLIHLLAHASINILVSDAPATCFGHYKPSSGKSFIKEQIHNKCCSRCAHHPSIHPPIPSIHPSIHLILTYFYLIPVGVHGYHCIWSYSITHTLSVGVLCTRDRTVTETSTWQHTIFTRDRFPYPRRDSTL